MICTEKFHGVTLYIDDMEAVPRYEYCNIFNWKTDLNQLKRIRCKRNKIVHSDDSSDEVIVTQNDINFIRDFYNRILNRVDPLSLYRKSKEVIKEHTTTVLKNNDLMNSNINNAPNVPKGKKNLFLKLLATGVLIVTFVIATVIIIEHII